MAVIASTEGLNKLAEDLRFLFDQRQVDTEVQICFADLGLTTISLFALLVDDVANVRVALAAPPFDLDPTTNGLDPATMLKRRIVQAKVLDAWQAAKCRADEKNKAEAKQRTSGMPISLTQGERVSLRQSFEKAFGRMEDEGFPASWVIERRLQEVEKGNPTAEPLSDVASSAEVSADAGNIVLDADGTFKMRRSTQKVPLPNDSEELRRRVRLLGHTFTIAKLQNPNRPWLATASSEVWLEHLDYVLGPRVWGFLPGRRRSPSVSSLAGSAQLRACSSSRGVAFGHFRGQELEGCHVRGAPLHRAPRCALYHACPREQCRRWWSRCFSGCSLLAEKWTSGIRQERG